MADQEKAKGKGEQPEPPEKSSKRRRALPWDRVINAAIATGTIVLAIFTYRLWSDTHQLVVDSEKTAAQQSSDTRASLDLTKKALDVSTRATKISKENLVATSRAWVGPANARVVGSIAAGKKLPIAITLLNSGREPARNVYIEDYAYSVKPPLRGPQVPEKIRECLDRQTTPGAMVLYPSSGVGVGGYTYTFRVPKGQIDADLISGVTTLFIQGCIVYETSGATRHSTYCYYYRAPDTQPDHLDICDFGSSAN